MSAINNSYINTRISVQSRNLITLPKEIRDQLNISIGDILDVRIEDGKIILEPYKLVPTSQAYFWTEKTQNDMKEAKNDINNGSFREFTEIKGFLEGLDND